MTSNYRPRLSAELTPEQAKELIQILPHGWQKPLFQVLVDGVISIYKQGGLPALGAIISKAITLDQVARAGLSKRKFEIDKRQQPLPFKE